MSFFDEEKTGQSGKRFRSWDETFIQFRKGQSVTVQVLEPKITSENVLWQHYIPQALRKDGGRGVKIQCPGLDVCPICSRNKDLERDHPDYIRPQKRFVVNVVDHTPGKKCSLCETVTYNSDKCSYCDSSLTEEELMESKVKLMERGQEMFNHLNVIEVSNTKPYDPNDETLDKDTVDYSKYNPGEPVPIGITHYPITIVTDREGKPIPVGAGAVNDLNWRDYEDQYIPIEEAYIFLEPFEIEQLLSTKVSLSEILKTRFQKEESSTELSDDIVSSF
jgi:hypothetical protein